MQQIVPPHPMSWMTAERHPTVTHRLHPVFSQFTAHTECAMASRSCSNVNHRSTRSPSSHPAFLFHRSHCLRQWQGQRHQSGWSGFNRTTFFSMCADQSTNEVREVLIAVPFERHPYSWLFARNCSSGEGLRKRVTLFRETRYVYPRNTRRSNGTAIRGSCLGT